MPLPPPADREPIHRREIACRGFRRRDGLWDIEGHLVDTKSYGFHNRHRGEVRPGMPVHEMWIRLTIDDAFTVRDIEAATDAAPFRVCPDVAPAFKALIGASIGKGWRRAVAERVGGIHGCTHLVELLGPLGTVAYQTIYPLREREERAAATRARPGMLDTCHALRSDGEVVKEHWPEFYAGR